MMYLVINLNMVRNSPCLVSNMAILLRYYGCTFLSFLGDTFSQQISWSSGSYNHVPFHTQCSLSLGCKSCVYHLGRVTISSLACFWRAVLNWKNSQGGPTIDKGLQTTKNCWEQEKYSLSEMSPLVDESCSCMYKRNSKQIDPTVCRYTHLHTNMHTNSIYTGETFAPQLPPIASILNALTANTT